MEKSIPKLLKKPKEVECFKCQKVFEIKFNRVKGEYYQKNNWYYWTEKEENKEKYICNSCLVRLYKKDKWEYLENITNLKRRSLLRGYVQNKIIT